MNKTELAYKLMNSVFDGKPNTTEFLDQTLTKLVALLEGATPLEQGVIYGCAESVSMLRSAQIAREARQ